MKNPSIAQKACRAAVSAIEHMPARLQVYRAYNAFFRMMGGRYWADTYFGASMLCDPNEMLQHNVLNFGVWEPNVSATIAQMLSPGDVCIDVGANVGYDTLLAATVVGPMGMVVAIEASPSIFELLSENVAANDPRNIRLVNKAASDKPGTIPLYKGPSHNIGRSTILSERGFELETNIEALPLHAILTPEELAKASFIKIDIEGAEGPVLQNFLENREMYRDDISLIVEVSPSDEWERLFAGFRAAGFDAYVVPNRYDLHYYLVDRRNVEQPFKIDAIPNEQVDVLFTKRPPPVLECRW